MDQKAIRELAILTHRALDIQENHWNWEQAGRILESGQAAVLAGSPKELVPLISLPLAGLRTHATGPTGLCRKTSTRASSDKMHRYGTSPAT